MNSSEARAAMQTFGLSKSNAELALNAMRDGGALAAAVSSNVPDSKSYLSFANTAGLNIAYVHIGFVDLRDGYAPDNAPASVFYEDIFRVKFPNYTESGSPTAKPELKPLANCPRHFLPLNPDGSCDYCGDEP